MPTRNIQDVPGGKVMPEDNDPNPNPNPDSDPEGEGQMQGSDMVGGCSCTLASTKRSGSRPMGPLLFAVLALMVAFRFRHRRSSAAGNSQI